MEKSFIYLGIAFSLKLFTSLPLLFFTFRFSCSAVFQ